MHNSVRMTIFYQLIFCKSIYFVFPCSLLMTIDEVDIPWCLSSNGEFLGVLRSIFYLLIYAALSDT